MPTTKAQSFEIEGKRYVLISAEEYERLWNEDKGFPPLPPADEDGNMPAIEFTRVSIARDLIRDRRAAGLSRKELADLAGVREQTIVKLESGKHSSSEKTLEKIDKALKKAAGKNNKKAKH